MEAPEGVMMGVSEFLAACGSPKKLYDGDPIILGRRIMAERKKRNWGIEETARKAKIHRQTLRMMEAAARGYTVDVVEAVAGAFGLTLEELCRGDVPDGLPMTGLAGNLLLGETLHMDTPSGPIEIDFHPEYERRFDTIRIKMRVRAPREVGIVFPHLQRARDKAG